MTGLTPRMRRVGWRQVRFDEMMDIDEEGERYIDNTFIIACFDHVSISDRQPTTSAVSG